MKKSFLSYLISTVFAVTVTSQAVSDEIKNTETSIFQNQQLSGFKIISNNIKKSPADNATYQGIQLDNGMTVLLISDPKANKSLMSAALPIGSMEDPVSQQGLAHYLEHMALMGSKKFPETNGLDHFLSKNGGRNNASTSKSRTAYYLEVNNNAFNEAVTRLADALAEPLLSEVNAKKELNAVNAEMVRAKSSDGYLMYSVNLATSNPNHPITKFAVGNKESLSDKPESKLQNELQQFYQKYYSANLVKAVLYSDQSIEKLQQLAVKTLGLMKNKHLQKPTINVPLYREQDKGIMISYKPIKPRKLLAVSFDFPNNEDKFKSKTNTYISYMLNNNTEGTLSDYLITQGLSSSGIQAGADPNVSRNRGDLTIYVELTEKGLEQKDQIISLIFQQIEQLKKAGIQESYFKEMKQSLAQSFEHLQVEKHLGFVEQITDAMLSYPLENVINAGFETQAMDQKEIAEKLAEMTLDNARILLMNKKVKTDKQTPYMNAPYSVMKFSPEQKSKWLDFSHNPTIKLPKLNPYFVEDFSLNKMEQSRVKPQKLKYDKGEKIYAMGSHYFPKEPKAIISLSFGISPKNKALKPQMTVALLNYMNGLAQTKLAFQSSVAGIETSFYYGENGVGANLSGYTQNFEKLLQDGLIQMKTFVLTEADLQQGKQKILEALAREKKENSLNQAAGVFYKLASYPYFDREKQKKALAEVSLEDVKQMRNHLLNDTTGIEVLSVGNLTDKQVKNLTKTAEKIVANSKTALNYNYFVDFRDVTQKINYVQQVPNEDNALVLIYLVKGNDRLMDNVRSMLLNDIISRWYFNDLRTDKQLGYVVASRRIYTGKTSGLSFMVQSPNTTPKGIMQHNERFFKESEQKLNALTDKEFEQYRASLLEKLQRKPESLEQEFSHFVTDFNHNNLRFDSREELIKVTKKITKQQIIDFYKRAVIEQSGFVLISQALGTKAKAEDKVSLDNFKTVTSIEELQKTLPVSHW
ncbi:MULTISPECIES: pitrilysin [Pasteurellaceae]|uniref:Protease 3 n=1 Tax=Pasteurella atlantica TaxID=2827233 RepID=A0AAW8CN55_9PAST|nr:pitrilysin [Pasteurella atlantica]MBR0573649.1 pitrilysin [Pasteurella atlantica]MDP8039404.1 pitrilysin [Pasteurella atlantica]MDP8041496.1 pitrilysin [Pasteurella atlantica]MDP8043579.1 pitrilysin [Pasteurella atlantica]MDP8045717.1 pitrilysin [Pasteurella atlantica]